MCVLHYGRLQCSCRRHCTMKKHAMAVIFCTAALISQPKRAAAFFAPLVPSTPMSREAAICTTQSNCCSLSTRALRQAPSSRPGTAAAAAEAAEASLGASGQALDLQQELRQLCANKAEPDREARIEIMAQVLLLCCCAFVHCFAHEPQRFIDLTIPVPVSYGSSIQGVRCLRVTFVAVQGCITFFRTPVDFFLFSALYRYLLPRLRVVSSGQQLSVPLYIRSMLFFLQPFRSCVTFRTHVGFFVILVLTSYFSYFSGLAYFVVFSYQVR